MANLGNFALMIATVLSFYGVAVSYAGGILKREDWVVSGRRAGIACFFMLSFSMVELLYLLATGDYSIRYVQLHSNSTLPMAYKLAALWAGMEGSLMLWAWMLLLFTALVGVMYRNTYRAYMPYVVGTCLLTATFFLTTNLTVANPFDAWAVTAPGMAARVFTPADGAGLNPQLQHWAMVIHPPTLYVGYVSTVIPFAFAFAALWTRRLGNEWLKIVRPWIVFSWLFLGAGILLGAKWAYVELGWGGYWAWDPVENASFMPWLLATALLHSIMVQERRGMLKVWNMILVLGTYMMCIFGTFLTRSGIISSVHTFAQSPVGPMFLSYLAGIGVLAGALVIFRLPDLKADHRLDSLLSRESAFLYNNVILVAACFSIFFGTMYPVISKAVTNQEVTVGPPFFNLINVPIGILILLLTGVGPLLAWRRTSTESLKRNFGYPLLGAVITGVALVAFGIREIYVVLSFALCAFVVFTIIAEFWRGTKARQKHYTESWLRSIYLLTRRNTRRYGGYLVHLGIVLIIFGVTGTAFNSQKFADLSQGESLELQGYELTLDNLREESNPHYTAVYADIRLSVNGKDMGVVTPYQRYYNDGKNTANSEVYIHQTLLEDLYINFAGLSGEVAQIRAYVKPLVAWIWIGGLVFVLGGAVALSPNLKEDAV